MERSKKVERTCFQSILSFLRNYVQIKQTVTIIQFFSVLFHYSPFLTENDFLVTSPKQKKTCLKTDLKPLFLVRFIFMLLCTHFYQFTKSRYKIFEILRLNLIMIKVSLTHWWFVGGWLQNSGGYVCSIFVSDDHSRVVLEISKENASDYINANYIEVSFSGNSNIMFDIDIAVVFYIILMKCYFIEYGRKSWVYCMSR